MDLGFTGDMFTWCHRRARDACIKARLDRRHNMIRGLKNARGVWEEGPESVEAIVLEYFGQIFKANKVCTPEKATSVVGARVSRQMNCQLTRVITSEEVQKAVFEMSPDKSPGSDEGLTSMLRAAEEGRMLTGVKISTGSPNINHILFADATLIFCKATLEEGTKVVNILWDYEEALGQKINFEKCSVSFERRTTWEVRSRVRAVLHINEVPNQGKYLGLPSHSGRSKKEVFGFV
ncbi:hypothetical protein LIER_35158 [Lithospermum erythrorhizon]|uniref:Reverse transcriptase n=1 Tax=Lithospermum erythrorhizon TaxID=34254 RepID=A0AAV3NLW9_LITER